MLRSLFLALVASLVLAEKARYDNYQVFRVTPSTEEQLEVLHHMENIPSAYKFWTDIGAVGNPVDVMVPPHLMAEFSHVLEKIGFQSKLFIGNVQSLIDNERPKNYQRPKASGIDWNDYYRVDDIYAWLDSLAEENPDRVSVVIGGESYEGRQLKGVKISSGSGNPAVFIDGGIHAREWISPAVTTYITNELISNPDLQNLANSFDWYIFPVINPDGYEYTFTSDRIWRKTRSPAGLLCHGVDANRNWGYHWNEGGASNIGCAETYPGAKAFSEIETQSLSEYIQGIQDLQVYISFHSYSQFILLPFGYTNEVYPDFESLYNVGRDAAAALAQPYGTQYQVGNIVDLLYVASGGSMDWVKGTLNTTWTFTFELRDTGENGFILPASEIIPSGRETLEAVVTIVEAARNKRK